jgi:phospholipid transport system transporter-binding protein
MSQIIVDKNDVWRLSGELSFATVGSLLTEFSQQIVTHTPPKVLDLSKVSRVDSAGLALLIEWLKQSANITFRNIPDQMQSLANVSGVQALLNLSE